MCAQAGRSSTPICGIVPIRPMGGGPERFGNADESEREISAEVLRGMELNKPQWDSGLGSHGPGLCGRSATHLLRVSRSTVTSRVENDLPDVLPHQGLVRRTGSCGPGIRSEDAVAGYSSISTSAGLSPVCDRLA